MASKQMPNRIHFETKTDYGKYSRNNSNQEYLRKSQYDLNVTNGGNPGLMMSPNQSMHMSNGTGVPTENNNNHHTNGTNSYKPVPPPKPKNYKPPLKTLPTSYGDDMGMPSSPPIYQHGKSNSHPTPMNEQRSPNYYYNIPPSAGTWHGGSENHFAQASVPYEHRHAGDGMHYTQSDYHRSEYSRFHSNDGPPPSENRANIVDLQGSREQRGSAFELYRKPLHHNLSSLSSNNMTNNHSDEMHPTTSPDNVTSATIDHKGGRLENKYWGVSLDIPEGAIPDGVQQNIYFVITDPRTTNNAPPLDLENGETLLSPLVMCGPQGLEFKKSVILNIPHYAHTLPSLSISLKATDSERDLCTDWDNILLPSNHTANSVAVKVDHF